MRIPNLTPELLFAVPCPTCGVDAGKPCLLHVGGLRPESHIDRTRDAAKAVETKEIPSSRQYLVFLSLVHMNQAGSDSFWTDRVAFDFCKQSADFANEQTPTLRVFRHPQLQECFFKLSQ